MRQGSSSVPASDTAIRRMIKVTDEDHFEAMRSINQDLTFAATKREFARRNLEFGPQQMRTLKLMDQHGLHTNLGLLLSDQCTHGIEVAVFQGNGETVFKDRREFKGALPQQMNDVYDYIDVHNHTRATIKGLLRVDVRDYPESAVRQALLNMLVHRDYSFSASGQVNLFADRMEILSIGGFMPGIDLEDILLGVSICRNQNLANVFCRLHLIEPYGTGIRRIMKAYEGSAQNPLIDVTSNALRITLPSSNASHGAAEALSPSKPSAHVSLSSSLSDNEEKVLAHARPRGSVTRRETIELLGTSASTATRILKKLMNRNLLQQTGNARRTSYTVVDQP